MTASEVDMLIRSLRIDDTTVSRNAACRVKDIYGSTELVASNDPRVWLWLLPHQPAEAKASARPGQGQGKTQRKMVAKFLRPGGVADDDGSDADVQAVLVCLHSSFNLLPVLKVRAEACRVLSAARCGCGRQVSSCAGADDGVRACRAKRPRARATRRPATSGFTTALIP
jgi:hypothetical protein